MGLCSKCQKSVPLEKMTLIKGDYVCQECLPVTVGDSKPSAAARLLGGLTKFVLSSTVGFFVWLALVFTFNLFSDPLICFLILAVLMFGCGFAGIFFFDQVLEKGFGFFDDTFGVDDDREVDDDGEANKS